MDERIEKKISALANRQRGYVKRVQLFALGLSRHGIAHRAKTGRLIPVYAGVYAVGHLPRLPHDRAYGALLAGGSEIPFADRKRVAEVDAGIWRDGL